MTEHKDPHLVKGSCDCDCDGAVCTCADCDARGHVMTETRT